MPADLVTRLILKNDKFERDLKASKKQLEFFNTGIKVASASVRSFVGGFAGMAGISYAFMDVVQKSMQFEKSLSSLRSLTGLSAQDMEYFKQKAIELGSTSTQTASQVVEAFQLIGSQQPELLKNKEALTEVTKQAIILAEAAGMDVPAAAKALSGSINQMGESANVASEYINILAAASQAGSADIQYLAKAIEKSGGAASSVGVEYNELVAAIEAIAPKITEASEAGTNLRNIFLTLESSSDKNLKPSVVGLSKAIENLAAKNLDATQMTKMFGKESVTAALAIVNAKDDYKKYLEAITGTNTALEQQKINNDNLAGSLNSISSAWEGFVLTLNKSNGQLKTTADFIAAILGRITEFVKTEQQKQNELVEGAVDYRKKQLKKEIDAWNDVLKDRKAAIQETMRQFSLRNPDGNSSLLKQIRKEELALLKMRERFIELKNKGKGYNRRSYEEGIEYEGLQQSIEKQRYIISALHIKNELYKQSVQYLEDELSAIDKIKEETEDTGNVGVTDEMRKKWRVEAQIDKLSLNVKDNVSDEIQKKINKEQPPRIVIKPDYIESEELPDIKGSIADYEKQIQDIVVAYNEATNSDLRAIYAKRLEDLRNAYDDMTDVNQGMIDIASQIDNLVQGSIVSGLEGLGEAFASNDPTEALRGMLGSMMDLLKQFGSALVAAGIAAVSFKKLLVNPLAAIAAGSALILAATAAKSALQKTARPLAEGGVIYGETFARVGEYPGAASNPEVVAPLSKLRDLIMPVNDEKKDLHITGELVGRGSNLVAVIDTYNKKQSRIR